MAEKDNRIKFDIPQDPTALFHFGDIELPVHTAEQKEKERRSKPATVGDMEDMLKAQEQRLLENIQKLMGRS